MSQKAYIPMFYDQKLEQFFVPAKLLLQACPPSKDEAHRVAKIICNQVDQLKKYIVIEASPKIQHCIGRDKAIILPN